MQLSLQFVAFTNWGPYETSAHIQTQPNRLYKTKQCCCEDNATNYKSENDSSSLSYMWVSQQLSKMIVYSGDRVKCLKSWWWFSDRDDEELLSRLVYIDLYDLAPFSWHTIDVTSLSARGCLAPFESNPPTYNLLVIRCVLWRIITYPWVSYIEAVRKYREHIYVFI